jgi:outer membrane protein assembly factor BamB
MTPPLRHLLTLVIVASLAAFASAGENWPAYRGPTHQGITDAKGLPVEFGESGGQTKNVTWKTPIAGKAWSSPVIWGDQIWLTSATEDGTSLFVYCVDKKTGKILNPKNTKIFTQPAPQYCHPFNSYGSPSPVIEEGRVYVTFGYAGTACIDTKTFKTIWERRDIRCNHFRGPGSSPFLWNDMLFMNYDGSDKQFVIALNKLTGETIWKTNRSVDYKDMDPKTGEPEREGDWRKAYATPRVIELPGVEPFLFSTGSKATYGYDIKTGKELWRIEHLQGHSVGVAPLVGDGLIYTVTGSKGDLIAIKPGGSGDVTKSHVVWSYSRNVPGRASPILVNGLIFMAHDQGGVTTCLDAKTGKEVWKERIGGEFSASPIAAEGRVYFFDQNGRVVVIKAADKFEKIAENKFDEGFMASPAVTGNALIVRTKTDLYRIEDASKTRS